VQLASFILMRFLGFLLKNWDPKVWNMLSPHPFWNLSFIRDAHDWKIESLDYFLTLLYSMNPLPGVMDSMVWTPSSRHGFAVKSYYTMLHSGEHSSFPWKSIWKVNAPPRIAFLLWAMALGRILTVDNLRRRRFKLINQCCLCKKDEKTINFFSFIVSMPLTSGT
jgi:hypothetical protein